MSFLARQRPDSGKFSSDLPLAGLQDPRGHGGPGREGSSGARGGGVRGRRGRRRDRRRSSLIGRFGIPVVLVSLVWLLIFWFADRRHRGGLISLRDAGLVILELAGILLVLILVIALLTWLCQPMGIVLREFENTTPEKDFDGRAIARAMTGELERVKAVHAAQHEPGQRDWALPTFVLSRRDRLAGSVLAPEVRSVTAEKLAAIGVVEVGPASVPVGQMLVALKEVWPLRRSGPVVTGRLSRHGASLRLAIWVTRSGRAGPLDFSVLSREGSSGQAFSDVVWRAAVRLAFELSSEARTLTPEGFEALSDSLEDYQLFLRSTDREKLTSSASHADRISRSDRSSPDVQALFYNLGVSHLRARELPSAQGLFRQLQELDPDNPVFLNALGVAYFEQRDFRSAKETFRRATELDPTRAVQRFGTADFQVNFPAFPWNGLGNTHVELAEYAEAITCYLRAIELDPDAAYAHNGLGNTYLLQDQHAEAEAEYDAAIASDPKSPYPWHGRGNLHARKEEWQEALRDHAKALRLDPSFAHALNGLGEANTHLGRPGEAVARHREAITLRPDDPYTHRSLGDTYLNLGEFDEALEELTKARRMDEQSPYVHKSLGDLYRRMGMPSEAREAYQRALALNPRDSRAWDGLGQAIRYLDDALPDERIETFTKARDINPGEPFTWDQLGEALFSAGRYRESITAHKGALALEWSNSFALDGLAKSHLKLGHHEAAKMFHRYAAQVNPADEYAYHGIAAALLAQGDFEGALRESCLARDVANDKAYVWNGLGDAQERLRRYDDAHDSYRRAIDLEPRNAYAQAGLARVALERADRAEAGECVRRALGQQREDPTVLTAIGEIESRLGQDVASAEHFRRSVVLDPRSTEAWDGLGKTYVWLGDYAAAVDAYQQAPRNRRTEWRLLLGKADVFSCRRSASQDTGGFLDEAELYARSARSAPGTSIAAHVRLGVIAILTGKGDPKSEASSALHAFDRAWSQRTHADADLQELKAMALLLLGRREESLAALAEALTRLPSVGRFESDRIGLYRLLNDELLPGSQLYQEQFNPTVVQGPPM